MRLIPEDLLRYLMQRPGELPPPGNDRWGKSVQLTPEQPSYTVVNVGYSGQIPTPWALQLSFSLDGIIYSPQVPAAFPGSVRIDLIKAADIKAGSFNESTILNPGDALPFCTLLAAALTVNVEIVNEGATSLWVHAIAAPTTMVDCDSITPAGNSSWDDSAVQSVPANTVGVFNGILANSSTKKVIVQNNSATDLILAFGSVTPSFGPPLVASIYLPGGLHSVWESTPGEYVGLIRGLWASVGSATEYATFTRGFV